MHVSAPKLRFAWKPLLVQSQLVGILVLAQFYLHAWTDQTPDPATVDQIILLLLLFGGVNLAVMYVGDRLARQRGWYTRSHYMGLGALASSAAHAIALAPASYVQAAEGGTLIALLLVPVLIGSATAFLMHRNLGYAAEGDDPDALARAVASAGGGVAAHDIGSAQYYDGPLQVRTSAAAGLIAAFAGSALFVFISFIGLSDNMLPAGAIPPLLRHNPLLSALQAICGGAIPFYIFVRRSHAFLQKRGKAGIKSYALAGVFVPLGFGVGFIALFGPVGLVFVLPWMFPSVLAITTYHHLAGLEPLDLPDDIEVRDPRTMLPADHVRRRVRRVVRAG